MENHFVVCSCNSSEHTLRFVYDKEHDEMYIEVQLIHHTSFLKRVVAAIKYIFGHTSRYGVWDCTLIDKKEAIKLKHFINRYAQEKKHGNSKV